jgi:hypothetical protein
VEVSVEMEMKMNGKRKIKEEEVRSIVGSVL